MVDIVANTTLGSVWDTTVRLRCHNPFLVFLAEDGSRCEYTYASFDQCVTRAARALISVGIGTGSVVALQLRNSPEFIMALLALAKIGAVSVPMSVKSTPAELLELYSVCQAEWCLAEVETACQHVQLRTGDSVLAGGVFSVHGATPGAIDFDALCEAQSIEPIPPQPLTSETLAELLFTSGTTATPKAVMITHANLVFSGLYAIWQTSMRPDDRVFTTMPACHSNFQLVALTGAICSGACLILCQHYSAHRFWDELRQERGTIVQLIAMMVRTLLLQPPTDCDSCHCVREALTFMPLTDEEKSGFETRFNVRLMNSYGSTESVGWVLTDLPQGERRWPSVGRPGLGYEVGIFDGDKELPPGEIGEIRVKGVPGRTLTPGYFGNPEATRRTLSDDGWLSTSDQGYYDEEGWFYFVDRASNLIKRSGENISATQIEHVLLSHPLIVEAAVIAVPDPVRDQAVKAFVRLADGAQLDEQEITDYCSERLSCHKVPQYVEIVTDFPRTTSMKIAKRLLR